MNTCESSYQDNVYEVHFEENPEEYMEVIRAIKNAEILFLGGSPLFDDIRFYDPQPQADLGYESENESDIDEPNTDIINEPNIDVINEPDIEIINEPDNSLLSASTSCDNLRNKGTENKSNQGKENK